MSLENADVYAYAYSFDLFGQRVIPAITTERIVNTISAEDFPDNTFSSILDFEREEHWHFTIPFFKTLYRA